MSTKLIIIETMHGIDELVPTLSYPDLHFVSTPFPVARAISEPSGTVLGIIKGPRKALRQQDIHMLVQQHKNAVISYIGRHPLKILAPDIRFSIEPWHEKHLLLETDLGQTPLVNLAHSPLSHAVAGYVVALAHRILTRHYKRVLPLTMHYGNTFAVRRPHSFSLDAMNAFYATRPLPNWHVGVLGTGDIGSLVIHAYHRIGSYIYYTGSNNISPYSNKLCSFPDFTRLFQHQPIFDLLTLHVPYDVQVPLGDVQRARLLINTASPGAIDPYDLLRALEEGRIDRVLLDVFDQEGQMFAPFKEGSQSMFNPEDRPYDRPEDRERKVYLRHLITAKRLFLTPHIAYYERHALREALLLAIANLLAASASLTHKQLSSQNWPASSFPLFQANGEQHL